MTGRLRRCWLCEPLRNQLCASESRHSHPGNVSLEAESLTTIGAIAVQGVRQANVTFGETVAVIGVGLVAFWPFRFCVLPAAG